LYCLGLDGGIPVVVCQRQFLKKRQSQVAKQILPLVMTVVFKVIEEATEPSGKANNVVRQDSCIPLHQIHQQR
jgi:hypothetical protein